MLTRRTLLGGVAAGWLASSGSEKAAVGYEVPLRNRAAARGLFYGCAAGSYQLNDGDSRQALAREANMLVPEYELKREIVEPRPGQFDYSGADALATFAGAHGMKMRGHTLVWYAANPPWLDAKVRV